MRKRSRRPKHPDPIDPLPDVVCHSLGNGLGLLVTATEIGREWFGDCPDPRVTVLTIGRIVANPELVVALMQEDKLTVQRR
jgi:hypothetical protein